MYFNGNVCYVMLLKPHSSSDNKEKLWSIFFFPRGCKKFVRKTEWGFRGEVLKVNKWLWMYFSVCIVGALKVEAHKSLYDSLIFHSCAINSAHVGCVCSQRCCVTVLLHLCLSWMTVMNIHYRHCCYSEIPGGKACWLYNGTFLVGVAWGGLYFKCAV